MKPYYQKPEISIVECTGIMILQNSSGNIVEDSNAAQKQEENSPAITLSAKKFWGEDESDVSMD